MREETVRQRRRAAWASFGDNSFLNDMGSFKEAQAARMKYLAQHMKLVKARYVKAHRYFRAKDHAAVTRRILGRWNRAFKLVARRHEAAIRKHKYTWALMMKSLHAKR